jgi:hypothetical protein
MMAETGPVRVYDTLGHVVGGLQQQQSALSFTSQYGTFAVESLPLVSPAETTPSAPGPAADPASAARPAPAQPTGPAAPPERASSAGTGADAVLAALGRLGDLHQRGILTDEEFAAKKAELLSRL